MENFYDHKTGQRMQQISIRKARKLFDKNIAIYLQSSNMPFNGVWQSACKVQKPTYSGWHNFDNVCAEYRFYNCDNERGKYIHFYVCEKDLKS